MMPYKSPSLFILAISVSSLQVHAADINYTGVSGGDWATDSNWSSATYPTSSDVATLNTTANLSIEAPNNIQGIRIGTNGSGRLQIGSHAILSATSSASVTSYIGDGSGNEGYVLQEGGTVDINRLEIGRNASTGTYHIHTGSLSIARDSNSISLSLGTDISQSSIGDGTFIISSGTLETRAGVTLGSSTGGIGRFEVIGSHPSSIGIGSNGTLDGLWTQNAGSTLSIRIDKTAQGVTPIFVDDVGQTDGGDGDVIFENGALLEVDFTTGFINGGTFTVMEWEGDVTDNGLQFAPAVDTNVWSFQVDAVNKRLTVTATGNPVNRTFIHPGISHKRSDLQRMKHMVEAEMDPWYTSYQEMAADSKSSYDYTVQGDPTFTVLARDAPKTNYSAWNSDIRAAYYNAIRWYVTGDTRHADKAVEIFNAWNNLTSVTSGGTDALSGGVGYIMIEAAEIIKSTYSGWSASDIQDFKDMLVYPGYSTTTEPSGDITFYWMSYLGDPGRHGNQGLSGWRTVMAMGIFLDNEIMYDRALRYIQGAPARTDDLPTPAGPRVSTTLQSSTVYADTYSNSTQSSIADYGYNELMTNYIWPNGQLQESSRDQQHAFFALGLLCSMAEMAWSQGDDLYSLADDRLLLGYEYSMRYNVSNIQSYPDQTTWWEPTVASGEFIERLDRSARWFSKAISPDGVGDFANTRPIFEIPVAHYQDRLGINSEDIKWTTRARDLAIEDSGYEVAGWTNDAIGWGALTFRRPDGCRGDPISNFSNDQPVYDMNDLPGTIEAENFDYLPTHGEGLTYHDATTENTGGEYRPIDDVDISTCSEGGYALTSLEADEWLTYTVAVPSSGEYDIAIRYAASQAGGKIKFSFGGVDATGEVTVPFGGADSTGLNDWKTFTVASAVQLPSGVQSMQVNIAGVSDSFILNNISIVRPPSVPVGNWKFDDASGSSMAIDSSGNGYDGTNISATSITGIDGGAFNYDGSSSQVTLPSSTFSTISDEITISMWVNGSAAQPVDSSAFYAVSGNTRVLNIHLPFGNSNIYWDAGNNSGYDRINKLATESEFKNGWNHWAFTKNAVSGSMKIYLNGVLWHSGTAKTKTMTGITAATIGSQITGVHYDGAIDDVRLYDVALLDEEITSLYYQYSVFAVSGLMANTSGGTQVDLNWSAASGASSYNLKRSLSSGGPYTTLASGLTALSYTDTGLTGGTTYHYVVSAIYDGIESVDSPEVSANPTPPIGTAPVITTTSLPPETIGVAYLQILSATSGEAPLTWALHSGSLPQGIALSTNGILSGTATASGTSNFTVSVSDIDGDQDTQTLSLTMYPLGGGPAAKFTIVAGDVTASGFQALSTHVPANTVDEDLETRWSMQSAVVDGNYVGEWIRYDLGSVKNVHYLNLAWLSGGNRMAYFDIEVSDDDTTWTPLATGLESSGTTTALETHDIPDTLARYVRIVGYGNSDNGWNSITEVEIWGTTPVPPLTPSNLTPTPADGQVALNWTVSENATLHHLKRSTMSNSGYTTIASEAGVSFLDTNVVNGTIYYYVVSAENDAGESADSAQVIAKPYAPISAEELISPSPSLSNDKMELIFDSVNGRIYQLQRSDSLDPVDWQDLGTPEIGDGNSITLEDPDAADVDQRFYRIEIQP